MIQPSLNKQLADAVGALAEASEYYTAPPAPQHLVTVRCWFHMERRTLFYCELDQSQMGYVELPNNSVTVEVPRKPVAECVMETERQPMHEGEIQAAWLGQGINEPMPYTFELGIRSAERFNGIKP